MRHCEVQTTVPQWEIFEDSFVNDSQYDNPFIDVTITAILCCGDQEFRIDGFYDGEREGKHVWKIRFSPMIQGKWEFKIISNDQVLNGYAGQFECTAPVSRGGLMINPQFPNWFFRADGHPQWIINDGWAPHPGFGNESEYGDLRFNYPSEQEWKIYLDTLARYRVNMFIEVDQLFARQDHITDPSFNWPWKVVDARRNLIDKDRFNLLFYQRLDRILAYAKERGIFYGLELLCDNSVYRELEWSHHPWNVANGGWLEDTDGDGTGFGEAFDLSNKVHVEYIRRYLAYTIARTSAYWNVYYALGAESGNLRRERADEFAAWYGYWGDFVALKDPHGRLMSIGDTGECEPLVRHPRNNIVITQEHTSMKDLDAFCHAINAFGERFWKYGRPVIIGEQDRFNNNCYDVERRGYWTAFASGFMMGRVDRHYAVATDDRLFESELFNLDGDPPIYADLSRLAQFISATGMKFWRMAPHDDLLIGNSDGVFCLAEPGWEYMIYFVHGGSAKISLPSGTFKSVWFDPRSGQFGPIQALEGDLEHTIVAPNEEDWVFYIALSENLSRIQTRRG